GSTTPYIGRFDLSENGFDYVMQQRPLNSDEHLELWMFFVSGLSKASPAAISQFKFVFDDDAGEQLSCISPYSVANDKGIVMGIGKGALNVMPRAPKPPNMRE